MLLLVVDIIWPSSPRHEGTEGAEHSPPWPEARQHSHQETSRYWQDDGESCQTRKLMYIYVLVHYTSSHSTMYIVSRTMSAINYWPCLVTLLEALYQHSSFHLLYRSSWLTLGLLVTSRTRVWSLLIWHLWLGHLYSWWASWTHSIPINSPWWYGMDSVPYPHHSASNDINVSLHAHK